jgi:hypothetical protein
MMIESTKFQSYLDYRKPWNTCEECLWISGNDMIDIIEKNFRLVEVFKELVDNL